jgi:hypothetical protein
MPDVQFEEEQDMERHSFKSRSILGQATTPGIARWLIKIGVVKNEDGAGRLMIILTVICFALSIYFFVVAAR